MGEVAFSATVSIGVHGCAQHTFTCLAGFPILSHGPTGEDSNFLFTGIVPPNLLVTVVTPKAIKLSCNCNRSILGEQADIVSNVR